MSIFLIFFVYKELIGNYIYMEEYFMRETVMKVNTVILLKDNSHKQTLQTLSPGLSHI